MKNAFTKIKSFILIMPAGLLAALIFTGCSAGTEAESLKNMEVLRKKALALDSLLQTESDKLYALDSMLNHEILKTKSLDSMINFEQKRLDSLVQSFYKKIRLEETKSK
jgi:hypothetical protein